MWLYLVGSLVGVAALVAIWPLFWKRTPYSFKDKHVIVSGASQGLGKELAIALVKRGANVTILARKEEDLKKVVEIASIHKSGDQRIEYIVCDVTQKAQVSKAFQQASIKIGPPHCVIPCAGSSVPKMFLETTLEEFEGQMQLNYFGSLYMAYEGAKLMKENKIKGRIVFVSSTMAFLGFVGFSPYAPTKWAVRSLADSLRNEFLMYDIGVHIVYPPSMDTPGYKEENRTKPAITKQIEDTAGLLKPENVATDILNGVEKNQYHITSDLVTELLRILSCGASSRTNLLLDMLALPILAGVFGGLLTHYDSLVKKLRNKQ